MDKSGNRTVVGARADLVCGHAEVVSSHNSWISREGAQPQSNRLTGPHPLPDVHKFHQLQCIALYRLLTLMHRKCGLRNGQVR